MAKLEPREVVRRARAAGLSLNDASALQRLHESEEDLTAMIEAYATDAGGGAKSGHIGEYDSEAFLKAVPR